MYHVDYAKKKEVHAKKRYYKGKQLTYILALLSLETRAECRIE